MDRTSIIVLVLCFVLLLLWPQLVGKLYPSRTRSGGALTNTVAMAPATNLPATTTAPPRWVTQDVPARPLVTAQLPEQTLTISSDQAHYTFSSHGGGLKLVELLNYRESVSRRQRGGRTDGLAALNARAPVPTLAVLGGDAVQGDGIFNLTRTANGVRAEKELSNGLVIVKNFQPSTNYLVSATLRLENRSDQPINLPPRQWVVGTATPMGEDDDGRFVGVLWYDGRKMESVDAGYFANRTLGCLPGTPRGEYRAGQSNVVWAAVQNQFFTLAVIPEQPAGQILARPVSLARPDAAEGAQTAKAAAPAKGYEATLSHPAVTLRPGETIEHHVFVFAGPKEYRTLAEVGDQFNNRLDLIMGYGGFFGGFARALLLAMNWLHDTLRFSYGWAIVVITIIVKLLFWPLTQASTRSMKRMQALQPQMKALQEKHKDDPVKMNKKLMEFMKEHKVSPLGGCLPMLVQIPVFIGFYKMILSAIELRGARFLWVRDLSRPDTLFVIPGLNFPFNLLPLIMGATMLWQARLTPVTPGADPVQQKMMKYMPLMFLVFLYNFSAGLTLYWTVQNVLTIAQMKLTRPQAEPSAPAPKAAAPKTAAPQQLPRRKK